MFELCEYNDNDPFLRHQINHRAGTFPDYTRQPQWHTGLVLKRPWLLDTAQNHCPNPDFLSLERNFFHFGTEAEQELRWAKEEVQECNATSASCAKGTLWGRDKLVFPGTSYTGELHITRTSQSRACWSKLTPSVPDIQGPAWITSTSSKFSEKSALSWWLEKAAAGYRRRMGHIHQQSHFKMKYN